MVFLIAAMLLLQTSVSICTATLKCGKMCLGAVAGTGHMLLPSQSTHERVQWKASMLSIAVRSVGQAIGMDITRRLANRDNK